jgi:uncharacterized protein YjbI with pentapeptide repeats
VHILGYEPYRFPANALIGAYAWTTVFLIPILLLLWCQAVFVPYHSVWVTWWHRVAICLDLLLVWILWPLVSRSAEEWRATETPTHKSALRDVITGCVSLVIVVLAFTALVIPGEGLEKIGLRLGVAVPVGTPLGGIECYVGRRIVPRQLDLPARSLVTKELPADVLASRTRASFGEEPWRLYQGLDLMGRDLRFAILSRSKLTKANLVGADLEGARLEDSALEGADLRWATLSEAVLTLARLDNANLEGAYLPRAILERARLRGALLSRVVFRSGSLANADLRGAVLDRADLRAVDFSGADLEGANLNGALLDGAVFAGARLQYASLEGAHLDAADLREAVLWQTSFARTTMELADVRKLTNRPASTEDCLALIGFVLPYDSQLVPWRADAAKRLKELCGASDGKPFAAEGITGSPVCDVSAPFPGCNEVEPTNDKWLRDFGERLGNQLALLARLRWTAPGVVRRVFQEYEYDQATLLARALTQQPDVLDNLSRGDVSRLQEIASRKHPLDAVQARN